jgi:hypothetical protein
LICLAAGISGILWFEGIKVVRKWWLQRSGRQETNPAQ